jgi:hypothetical protein
VLIAIYINMWPCYVKWFNYLEISILIIIMGLYSGAFTIMLTGNYIYGWIVFGIITTITILLLVNLLNQLRKQGGMIKRRAKGQVGFEDAEIPGNPIRMHHRGPRQSRHGQGLCVGGS